MLVVLAVQRAVGMAVPLHVEKLLKDFESNGRADFTNYVRAFEPVFADMNSMSCHHQHPTPPSLSVSPSAPQSHTAPC